MIYPSWRVFHCHSWSSLSSSSCPILSLFFSTLHRHPLLQFSLTTWVDLFFRKFNFQEELLLSIFSACVHDNTGVCKSKFICANIFPFLSHTKMDTRRLCMKGEEISQSVTGHHHYSGTLVASFPSVDTNKWAPINAAISLSSSPNRDSHPRGSICPVIYTFSIAHHPVCYRLSSFPVALPWLFTVSAPLRNRNFTLMILSL